MTEPATPVTKPIAEPSDERTPVWMKRVAMVTGVLAGLAGFLTVRSANMSNQVNYHSILAVLNQSKSSDAYAEYQADSIKRHINENAEKYPGIDPATRNALDVAAHDYRSRQDAKMDEAKAAAKLRDEELDNGAHMLAQKGMLDYAGVAAQLGIALASVAALTRKQPVFHIAVVVGFLALFITGYALGQPYLMMFLHHL